MKYYKALYTIFAIMKKDLYRMTYEATVPGRLHTSPEDTEKNMGEET